MDLAKKPQLRILKVLGSKKVKAAEKIIMKRTDWQYQFDDLEAEGVVRLWGHRVGTNELTSIAVRL